MRVRDERRWGDNSTIVEDVKANFEFWMFLRWDRVSQTCDNFAGKFVHTFQHLDFCLVVRIPD